MQKCCVALLKDLNCGLLKLHLGQFFSIMSKIIRRYTSFFGSLGLLAIGFWSCSKCANYILRYSYSNANLVIFDNIDYNEDSTATIETIWKSAENKVLSDKIKVGLNFIYTSYPDTNRLQCKPDYEELSDSVKGIDIVTVYPLEGIAAGQSILAAGGWDRAKIDSLVDYMNLPFFPSYGSLYLMLPNKALEGKIQLKAIITKNKKRTFEVLSDELAW